MERKKKKKKKKNKTIYLSFVTNPSFGVSLISKIIWLFVLSIIVPIIYSVGEQMIPKSS